MKAASLTSARLQRVLALLKDGRKHTTRDIVRGARVMAVSACISELRQHGAQIDCTVEVIKNRRRYHYQMTREPNV